MSVQIEDGGDYLYTLTEPVSSYPLTISCWLKTDDIVNNGVVVALDKPDVAGYLILGAVEASGGVANDPVRAYVYNGSAFGIATTSTGYNRNTWTHLCGVFESTSSRAALVDGGSKGTNFDSRAGILISELIIHGRRRNSRIGMFGDFTPFTYIAEVAVWNTGLSDQNIALLASGRNPTTIAAGNLVAYWPLLSDSTDSVGSNDLTEVDGGGGSLTYSVDHPTITGAPSKATTPTPANAATDVTLDQATLTWVDGGGATSYDVYYGTTSGNLTKVSSSQAGLSFTISGITNGSPFDYLVTRYWRIDSINATGTTTGDEWSFTTMRLSPPTPIDWYQTYYYQLLIQDDGSYGVPPPTGTENVDYVILDETYSPNFINTSKRLVAAANNKMWYESI